LPGLSLCKQAASPCAAALCRQHCVLLHVTHQLRRLCCKSLHVQCFTISWGHCDVGVSHYMWITALQQSPTLCMSQIGNLSSVHQGMPKHGSHMPWTSAWLAGITRANGPSRDRAFGRNVYFCLQPSEYALCTRPFTIILMMACRQLCCESCEPGGSASVGGRLCVGQLRQRSHHGSASS
jgi:hypothetical protein